MVDVAVDRVSQDDRRQEKYESGRSPSRAFAEKVAASEKELMENYEKRV